MNFVTGYNKHIFFLFIIAPLFGFLINNYLNLDFNRIMQLLSYLGIILILIFKKSKTPIVIPNYIKFYFLFILYDFFSTFILLEREFKLMYLFSNPLIGGLNMMIIIENIHVNKIFFNASIKYNKIILFSAFIVILIQQAIDPNFFILPELLASSNMDAENINESRLPSIYSWVSDLAKGFGFVPIFIILIEYLRKTNKKFYHWIIIGFIYAFLTKARWIMLNTLLVIVILIIHDKHRVLKFLKLALIIPIIFLSSHFILNSIGVKPDKIINNRVKSNSLNSRFLAYAIFNKVFWENPVLGKGNIKYGMGGTGKQDYKLRSLLAGRSSQLHVGYLSLLYMYGILGAFFFLSFLFLLLKKLYLDAKKTMLWGPFLGMIGFAIANFTLVTLSIFEMGLIYALVINKYYLDCYNEES